MANCNNPKVKSEQKIIVGGVSGSNNKFTNCYNTGFVKGQSLGGVSGNNNKTVQTAINTGLSVVTYVGGVNGYNGSRTIINCNATGEVNGTDSYVGGVIE